MAADRILLGHGSGGRLSGELIEEIIIPALMNGRAGGPATTASGSDGGSATRTLDDAAVLTLPAPPARLAYTTDSFVVSPLFFPGGNIGDLAINGTVNDLAMMGARPHALTLGLIIEEGLAIDTLKEIMESISARAAEAGVEVVAGDTKVVERGKADGIFINTSGIGLVPEGRNVSGSQIEPGDIIIVSGTIGDHGIAVLSEREGLSFSTPVESDCAPLNDLVEAIFATGAKISALRDPTRGGLATTLNEFAAASSVGITIDETAIPIRPEVERACEMLGLDPLYVANEGKLVAVVSSGRVGRHGDDGTGDPHSDAQLVLQAMRQHPLGQNARIIGEATPERPGRVVLSTGIGGKRIIDMLSGDQLPRIC